MLRKVTKATFLILIVTISVWAQNTAPSAGTSSNLLLRFGTSAKVAGLSESFTGLANDENTLFYNPAGLPNILVGTLGLNHSEWLEDIRIDNIVYGQQIYPGLAFGAGITHMWMPALQGKDQYGNSTTEFDVSSSIAQIGMGYRFNRFLSIGAAAKYFQDNLADFSANGFAYDAGIYFMPFKPYLSIGLAVQNMGGEIKYDQAKQRIPLTYRAGVAIYLIPRSLIISSDLVKSVDTEYRLHVGTEYTFLNFLTLRAGNRFEAHNLLTPSYGMGLNLLNRYRFDYTFYEIPELGLTHRIGISIRFSDPDRTVKPEITPPRFLRPPTKVRLALKENQLIVYWNTVNYAAYNLYAKYYKNNKWVRLNKKAVHRNYLIFKKPTRKGIYYFNVKSVINGIESEASKIVFIQISADGIQKSKTHKNRLKPPVYVNVKIKNNRVDINWNSINGVLYNIYARVQSKNKWVILNKKPVTDNSISFKKPRTKTKFYFKVTTILNGHESPFSKEAVLNVK